MSYCFQHCNCNPHTEIWDLPEYNPDYIPFNYVTYDNGKTFKERTENNLYEKIGYWCFNGDFDQQSEELLQLERKNDTNIEFIGPSIKGGYVAEVSANNKYMCPPDLLRYCTTSCKVNGLFAYSGIQRVHTAYNNYNPWENWTIYGITGRICPYLLKPVSKITDISYMFTACKKLTAYSNSSATNHYLIPKDFFTYAPNISNLSYAFAYMIFAKDTNLDVFQILQNPLNISYAFFGSFLGGYTEDTRLYIGKIFEKNTIDNLRGVFANSETGSVSTNNVSAYAYNQRVTFDGVFNKKYASGSYATSDKFKYAFSGYHQDAVIFENKTLSENASQFNYATVY